MFYIILIFGIVLDLFTKYLSIEFLQNKINILGDFLYLDLVKNPGIAFGINVPFLKIVTIILIIGIFYYYIKEEKIKNSKYIDISFALILSGAIGNAIERIIYSEVTDFIGVKYFSVFNLADSFISIGAILYIYCLYKYNK